MHHLAYSANLFGLLAVLAYLGRMWLLDRREGYRTQIASWTERLGEVRKIAEQAVSVIGYLENRCDLLESHRQDMNERNRKRDEHIDALESRTSEPVDVAKFNTALANLVRETREELAKRITRDDMEAELKKLRASQAAIVATGNGRHRV